MVNKERKKFDPERRRMMSARTKRYFKRTFSVADNCEVKDAQLKDGMLTISLEKKEAKKPRMIDIK